MRVAQIWIIYRKSTELFVIPHFGTLGKLKISTISFMSKLNLTVHL